MIDNDIEAKRKKREIEIGVFVLVAVLVISGMVLISHNSKDLFVIDSFLVDIRFKEIGDLQLGAPVKLGGVRVGRVESFELCQNGVINVVTKIYSGTPLWEDTYASIATSGIMGERFIELTLGKPKIPFPKDRSKFIEGRELVISEKEMKEARALFESLKE